jgi:hypothetical protein
MHNLQPSTPRHPFWAIPGLLPSRPPGRKVATPGFKFSVHTTGRAFRGASVGRQCHSKAKSSISQGSFRHQPYRDSGETPMSSVATRRIAGPASSSSRSSALAATSDPRRGARLNLTRTASTLATAAARPAWRRHASEGRLQASQALRAGRGGSQASRGGRGAERRSPRHWARPLTSAAQTLGLRELRYTQVAAGSIGPLRDIRAATSTRLRCLRHPLRCRG